MEKLGDNAWIDGVRLVEMFHSENTAAVKDRIIGEFPKCDSKVRCLISTIAFGMGVQIPDVRLVIHFGAPDNLLNYQQEMGRCARDGESGIALLMAYPMSISKSQCEENVRKMVREADSTCVRQVVLDNLCLAGMNTKLNECIPCTGCTKEVCECDVCR